MAESVTEKRLRRAARILVLDPAERLLMFRFTVDGRPPFWVTAGGECDPGESFEDAARRELLEETGIEADPGPQIEQICPEFVTVEGEPVRADERYFRIRVSEARIDTSGHTQLEQRVMQEHRWFTRTELTDWHEYIFPRNVAELIDKDAGS
ncbi:NUDIX hydrolase [Parerythrobacter jejuensis]|uniref:NUDIX domain-containing protein n=1 Tax=Parerythrobacter jejuensis TaxID=795812 RepID=A0A845ASJ3_9SPHN|nr:NUDIX domain-containing protein [Parerythrobacter jejuensis]MXP31811.1 NUDIX domain-containing protein [Parerythrobacter jejuensis]